MVNKPDCSHHKKDVAGISDMKRLATMIANLHYESLYELFYYLENKVTIDAANDRIAGRKELANELESAALNIGYASENIRRSWEISKPFMK